MVWPDKPVFADENLGAKMDSWLHFSIYVFFPSREEAIALELFEGMQRLKEINSQMPFSVHVEFTWEGGNRLSKHQTMEIIQQQMSLSKVERIYVCGPPSQNIMFYELKDDIVKNYGINYIEIL